MKFLGISCDPNGVYVAYDKRGWLWHYMPTVGKWILFFTGEDYESKN